MRGLHAPDDRSELRRAEGRLELGEPPRVGNHDDHGKLFAVVRQLDGDEAVALHAPKRPVLTHERHHRRTAVKKGKLAVVGQVLGKRRQPGRVEVDGVGEDQPRQFGDRPLRDEILDLALGRAAHPVVDRKAGRFGRDLEIHEPHAGIVVFGQGGEVRLEEGVAGLPPDRIRDVQPEALAVGALGPLPAARELEP